MTQRGDVRERVIALVHELGPGFAGRAAAWVRGLVDSPTLVISITLLTPYLAYVPAERLHVSGVLAAVTVAYWRRRRGNGPALATPAQ